MSKPVILITGSQRSGTTLLHLILDSHPDVTGIDEGDYDPAQLQHYRQSSALAPNLSLKLPAAAHAVSQIKSLAPQAILWCLRDPRDVVRSMMRLTLGSGDETLPWASHPQGAPIEIKLCQKALMDHNNSRLGKLLEPIRPIARIAPDQRSRLDNITVAAVCWSLKNQLLSIYDDLGLDYYTVNYESLISDPEAEIHSILTYCSLPWHDNVLAHHTLHRGIVTGGTDSSRAIDGSNHGHWQSYFNDEELVCIETICGDTAKPLGLMCDVT